MTRPEDNIAFKTVTLERFKFIARQVIGDYAFLERARLETHEYDAFATGLVCLLKAEIFGEHLERATVTYPATWKEAVKEALYTWLGTGWDPPGHWPWFGDYCRERWPVAYRIVFIDVQALYPNISVPQEIHAIYVARDEDWS